MHWRGTTKFVAASCFVMLLCCAAMIWGSDKRAAHAEAEPEHWEQVGQDLNVELMDAVIDGEAIFGPFRYNGGMYMKYFDGAEWRTLGGKISAGNGYSPSVVVHRGVPYIGFRNDVMNQWGFISVKSYNWERESWESVGANGFSDGPIIDTSLAVDDDGTLYAMYRLDDDDAEKNGLVEVKRHIRDEQGEWGWYAVGDLSAFPRSPSSSTKTALAIEDGVLYAAYYDTPESGFVFGEPVVLRYNFNETDAQWERLSGHNQKLHSEGTTTSISLAIFEGTPYLAYRAYVPYTISAYVFAYRNGEWEMSGAFPSAEQPRVLVAGGQPYVSYRSNNEIEVQRYDGAGWRQVGDRFTGSSLWNLQLQHNLGKVHINYNDNGWNHTFSIASGDGLPAPPQLAADVMKFSGATIEITFPDDADWRNAITSVRSGTIPLGPDTYVLSAGKLTLQPNTLLPGVHQLKIYANGYGVASARQEVRPNAPEDLRVVQVGHTFAQLNWSPVVGSEMYRVYYKSPNDAEQSLTVLEPFARVTGLTDDEQYAFRVTAISGSLESPQSDEVFATPFQEMGTGDVWERLIPAFPGLHPVMDWDGEQLVVAYRHDGAASVRRWEGSSWAQLGPVKISSQNALDPVVITEDNGSGEKMLYIGYADQKHQHKLSVQTFDSAANTWHYVGPAGFSTYKSLKALFMGLFRGTPYIAYVPDGPKNEVHVLSYDEAAGDWVVVGGGPVVAAGTVTNMKFIIQGSTAYLGYVELVGNGYDLKMLRVNLDESSPQWEEIDTSGFPIVLQWTVGRDFFTVDDDTLYVTYYSYDGGKIELKQWTVDGGWHNLGGPVIAYTPYNVSMDLDGDALYLLTRNGQAASSEISIWKRLNGNWFEVGQGIAPEGGIANFATVKSVNNRPYVSFYNGKFDIEIHRMAYTWCEAKMQYNNGQPDETFVIPCGEPIPDPGSPTREGFIFTGWRINNEVHDFQNPVHRDVTVSAGWRLPTPGQLAAEYGDGKVRLSWDAVEHASGYKVYISTTAGTFDSEPVIVTGTAYAFDQLTNGVTYFFAVQATDGATDSLRTAVLGEKPRTVPDAPLIEQVHELDSGAVVMFKPPQSDGGAVIQKYVVSWKHTDQAGQVTTGTVEGTKSPITVADLTNKRSYMFTVTAFNSEGESLPSAPVEATPHKVCTVALYAWDDAVNRVVDISCGDYVEEPRPEPRAQYTFDGWFDAEGRMFDFSQPIEQELVNIFGRWSFDPAQLPPETWHIIDADPDVLTWAYAMEDDVMYLAKRKNDSIVVRKYDEKTGWSPAAVPLEDMYAGSPILDMEVRDGQLYILHYNAEYKVVVSAYDAEAQSWLAFMPVEAGDYPDSFQLVAADDALYVSMLSGIVNKSVYIWRNAYSGSDPWANVAPELSDVFSLNLISRPAGLAGLFGTLNAAYSEDLHLLQLDLSVPSEHAWTSLADLSAFPRKSLMTMSGIFADRDDALLLAYLTDTYEKELLYVKDGQADVRDVPSSSSFDFDVSGMNGNPYHFGFEADEIEVYAYKDGSWTVRDRIPTLENSFIYPIDSGGSSGTQYISYKNSSRELITRFYSLPFCTVAFDSKGGGEASEQTVRCGQFAEAPSVQWAGYVLEGWYTDSEYAEAWDFALDAVTEDIVLFAKWTRTNPNGPTAPELHADTGDREVTLSWASDPDAEKYAVHMGTSPGVYDETPLTTLDGDAESYTVTGLVNGTVYYFIVRSTNIYGESADSSEISAMPAAVPSAPTNVAAAVSGSGRATVTFTVPEDDGGLPITGYEVTADQDSITATGTGTSIEVTGLENGTTYTFTVRAKNDRGWGSVSEPSNAVTPNAPLPVSGLVAEAGNREVKLSWTNDSDAASHIVYMGTSSGAYDPIPLTTLNGDATSYTADGLANGMTYYFMVRSTNIYGESADSSEISAMPAAVPSAPTNVAAAVSGSGRATVTFTLPEDDGGLPITGYEVTADQDGITSTGTGTSIEVTGLSNGTTYTFTVRAKNDRGWGSYSASSNAVTPSVPLPADGLAAEASNREVKLSWSSDSNTVTQAVYMGTSPGVYDETPLTTLDGDADSYTVTGLVNGTVYYFIVRSTNIYGESADSNEASAMPAAVPSAPTNVAAAISGSGRATVTFTVPEDDGGLPITGYEVTADKDGITATGTGTSIEVTGLSNGTTYTFTVRARNDIGWGIASEPSNKVTPVTSGDNQTPQNPGNNDRNDPDTPQKPSEPDDNSGVEILINGQSMLTGTTSTVETDGQTITTIAVDPALFEEQMDDVDQHARITVRTDRASDVTIAALTGQIVKSLELKDAVIEMKTDDASYIIPAKEIDISAVAAQLGTDIPLQDIAVRVEIAAMTDQQAAVLERVMAERDWAIVATPLNFTVQAEYNGRKADIARFDVYVERGIALPEHADPGEVTTAVVVEADGTVRHVPTKVVLIEGRYYAVINSLTNSVYVVVRHKVEFADMAGHWAQEAVNDMGSRLVVEGSGGGKFEPDTPVTRAQFVAMLVRGLGLKPGEGTRSFTDVEKKNWYHDTVTTAYAYRLIEGYHDGTFRPDERITREQAMVMINRAMALAGLSPELADAEKGLESYSDYSDISAWAKSGVAASVRIGIVTGRSGQQLAPKLYMTRAETIVIIRRLLQVSELI